MEIKLQKHIVIKCMFFFLEFLQSSKFFKYIYTGVCRKLFSVLTTIYELTKFML